MSNTVNVIAGAGLLLLAIILFIYTLRALTSGTIRSLGVFVLLIWGGVLAAVHSSGVDRLPQIPPSIDRAHAPQLFWRLVVLNLIAVAIASWFGVNLIERGYNQF